MGSRQVPFLFAFSKQGKVPPRFLKFVFNCDTRTYVLIAFDRNLGDTSMYYISAMIHTTRSHSVGTAYEGEWGRLSDIQVLAPVTSEAE